MRVFWQHSRRGQRLVLAAEEQGIEEEVGGVRETKGGFDAFAKTFSYEPGRAQKGIPTMEEAKAFVEGFRPWGLYEGAEGLAVEQAVMSLKE